jgi:hypothetical protein
VHDIAAPQGRVLGCCWQAPPPLHAPVFPQGPLLGQRPCGSVVPEPTFAQVPSPLTLQAWQVGQLEALQQAASTQLPLTHWSLAVQAPPSAFFATQLPLAQ